MNTRTWFRVHSFTGVITGLLLFVICWSGSFAVISYELDWLVTPQARVEPVREPVSWGALENLVETAYPQAAVGSLSAPLYRRSAAEVVVDLPWQDSVRVYVDPYSGRILGEYSYFNIQRFFRSFHMNLFIPLGVGSYTVMVFALTLLVSMVAPLVFYKRWWRRFLRFKSGGGRVFWSELHKLVGLWSLWFVLIIALTGVWYLFEALRGDLGDGRFNYVGEPPYGVMQVPAPGSDPALPSLTLDEVITVAKRQWPELEINLVARGWYSGNEDTIYLEGQAGFPLVRDRANQMHLDPRTGEVLWQNSAGDLPVYWIWSNMADPLHFGNFAGLTSKLIWFVFGLALSGLILTGTWLHAQRLAREAGGRSRHLWPGTLAAVFVSLAVLGASVPFGFQEAREFYGPTVDGVKRLPTLAPGVRAVIGVWAGLTVAIIAAWTLLLWRPRTALGSVAKSARFDPHHPVRGGDGSETFPRRRASSPESIEHRSD